jgi:hypothetical protein
MGPTTFPSLPKQLEAKHLNPGSDMAYKKCLTEDMGGLVQEFCRAVGNRYVMRRLQDAFEYHLKSYVSYAYLGIPRSAKAHRQKAYQLIKRAKQLSKSTAHPVQVPTS